MKIKKGHQFIRLQLLSNTNMGAAAGRVTLDRPTQKDTDTGLPFLPNSAIRGVLAATTGSDRHKLFGQDFVAEDGLRQLHSKPGTLVPGNGELLCFPVVSLDEQRCWVFPIIQIYKILTLQNLLTPGLKLNSLAGKVGGKRNTAQKVVSIPRVPRFNLPVNLEQSILDDDVEYQLLGDLLTHWLGDFFPSHETKLFTSTMLAEQLWLEASDIRDMTRLESKMAATGSLRRMETIPPGSIFLSFTTLQKLNEYTFPSDIIQVGSAEGTGLGFIYSSVVKDFIKPEKSQNVFATQKTVAPIRNPESRDRLMLAMREAWDNAGLSETAKDKARSAIRTFGMRMRQEDLETAIAFSLARAKPNSNLLDFQHEKKAHRWLLQTILNQSELKSGQDGALWFGTTYSVEDRINIEQRWLWLRRVSEKLESTSNES